MSSFKLRDYQQDIIGEVEAQLAFDDKVVIALGMGGGKSAIASQLTKDAVIDGKYVVVLTNFSALIPQLSAHLTKFNIPHNIVKAGIHKIDPEAKVSLIMEQSFHEKKRDELNIQCDYLIKDEAHVGIGQKRYEDIAKHLNPSQTVYMTATPLDERGYIMSGVTEDQVITIGSTKELTDLGYLTPIKTLVPKWAEEISYDEVVSSGNDYNGKDIDNIVNTIDHTTLVLSSMNDVDAINKKTLVYCSSIEHADLMLKELTKQNYLCAVVHSKMPREHNELSIDAFNEVGTRGTPTLSEPNGTDPIIVNCLISVMSLAIGFDSPKANLLVMLRPTKVLRLFLQLVNRPGRLYKPLDALIERYADKIENIKKRIAFVAKRDIDIVLIKSQLKDKNITNIDVFKLTDMYSDYEFIELDVEPNKPFAELLDLAQCTKNLGFLDEPIRYIAREDKKALIGEKDRRAADVMPLVVEDAPTEVSRELIDTKVREIENKAKHIRTMEMNELINLYATSTNIKLIIAIALEMDRRLNGVKYNEARIDWICGPIYQLISDFPELKHRIIKTYRTRAKNIIRDKKKTSALYYFDHWLRDNPPYVLDQSMRDFADQ